MSDGMQVPPAADPAKAVAKSRLGLLLSLLGIVAVIGAIAGVMYFTGIGPFATGDGGADSSATPGSSTDATETAGDDVTTSELTLPPADAQEAMYREQVASNGTITELVDNEWGSFQLSQIATSADKADIRVTGTYRDGSTLNGWMLLRKYSDLWYFSMITRDGNPAPSPISVTPDPAVIKTIVEQQAANQEIYKGILDGSYTVMAIDAVSAGSGTATVDVTLTGGTAGEAKAKITCISKDVEGTTHWFITGFSKS